MTPKSVTNISLSTTCFQWLKSLKSCKELPIDVQIKVVTDPLT